jgi:sensor histidine kinase YesM
MTIRQTPLKLNLWWFFCWCFVDYCLSFCPFSFWPLSSLSYNVSTHFNTDIRLSIKRVSVTYKDKKTNNNLQNTNKKTTTDWASWTSHKNRRLTRQFSVNWINSMPYITNNYMKLNLWWFFYWCFVDYCLSFCPFSFWPLSSLSYNVSTHFNFQLIE